MAAMDMERLDEGPALDQFYGVVPVGMAASRIVVYQGHRRRIAGTLAR
ncbi:MAG: hypothetical protein E6Z27_14895 [Eggerthella sp.]|nr:hypothetical protein [Eggerthella sp.]MDU5903248.1 hypothetical protein [Eggerthella sp.]